MIEDHLGVVDETGAAAERTHSRLRELLDREILPCLERPGRQLGPYDVPLRATTGRSNLALVFPSQAEGIQAPAALRPLFEIVAPRRDIQPSLACAPAADLEHQLESRGLPLFGRPDWTPLTDPPLWIVLLSEPLDLLGFLTILRCAHVPTRTVARCAGPTIIATGPGAERSATLCRVFADAVIALDDLDEAWFGRWITACARGNRGAEAVRAAGLGERGTVGGVEAPDRVPVQAGAVLSETKGFGSRREEQEGLLVRGSANLRRPERAHESGRNTAFTERVWVGAASARLRERHGMIHGDRLASILGETFATEAGAVALDFVWGLPEESSADRAALASLLDAIVGAAPRGVRQVRARLGWYVPSPAERAGGATTIGIGEAEASLARLREELKAKRLRLDTTPAARAAVAALLEDAPAGIAPVLEAVHAAGARTADLASACDPTLWDAALRAHGHPGLERAGNAGTEAEAPAERHGLGRIQIGSPSEVRPAHHAGHEPRANGSERWKRWSMLVPRQFEIRIEFTKKGRARFLGPGELTDLFLGALERAGIPLATAGVVEPRPKLSFGPALPAGIAGECEVVDLGLSRPVSDLLDRLVPELPKEIGLRCAVPVPPHAPQLALGQVALAEYAVHVSEQQFTDEKARAESLERLRTWSRRIDAGEPCVDDPSDILRQLHALDVSVGSDGSVALRFELDLRDSGPKCKPRDVLVRGLTGLDVDVRCLPLRRLRLLMLAEEPLRVVAMTPLERVRQAERRQRARAKFSA